MMRSSPYIAPCSPEQPNRSPPSDVVDISTHRWDEEEAHPRSCARHHRRALFGGAFKVLKDDWVLAYGFCFWALGLRSLVQESEHILNFNMVKDHHDD